MKIEIDKLTEAELTDLSRRSRLFPYHFTSSMSPGFDD